MNLNGEDKNDKSCNNDDSNLQLSYLSQNSVKIELLNNKKLINFYEECEYHNELLGYLNSNIQLLLRRTKALKSKEDKLFKYVKCFY